MAILVFAIKTVVPAINVAFYIDCDVISQGTPRNVAKKMSFFLLLSGRFADIVMILTVVLQNPDHVSTQKGHVMNPEQALTRVQHAIENRPIANAGPWYITYYDGSFHLVPAHKQTDPFPNFGRISLHEITTGLSTQQWNQIRNRISICIAIGIQI